MTLRSDSAEVRFLLGELSDEERAGLEEKYFADDKLFHELLEVETDLVDAYVKNDLTPAERQRFEAALEKFPLRREKIEFARALHRLLTRPTVRELPGWRRMLPLAAMLIFTVGAAWFAIESVRLGSRREALDVERGRLIETVKGLERQTEDLRARIADLGSQAGTSTVAPRIASFVLVSGSTRGGSSSNELRVPETADAIIIEASVEDGTHDTYRAAIQSPSGETVFMQRGLKPRTSKSSRVVAVLLSPAALAPGDYILVVSGEKPGRTETVGEFAFRVLRKA